MDPELAMLQTKIANLELENKSLKSNIELLYSNWTYDYTRFTELKAKCRNGNKNI